MDSRGMIMQFTWILITWNHVTCAIYFEFLRCYVYLKNLLELFCAPFAVKYFDGFKTSFLAQLCKYIFGLYALFSNKVKFHVKYLALNDW